MNGGEQGVVIITKVLSYNKGCRRMADPQQKDKMDERHKIGHIFNQLNSTTAHLCLTYKQGPTV